VESNVILNSEKCATIMTEDIVLGNHISPTTIEVDRTRIEVILKLPPPERGKKFYFKRWVL